MPENAAPFDQWGIVEVMGHKKYAGHITEQVIAGSALVRVDVPEVQARDRSVPAYSKLVGVGSIYMITPTTEEIARAAAAQLARYDSDPLPVYIPEERQLPARATTADDDDFEFARDDDDDELEEGAAVGTVGLSTRTAE